MMKWIPVVLALLLTACSSSNQKTYYQLPVLSSAATTGNGISSGVIQRHLWVERVSVADYLAGSGLVYQTNEIKMLFYQGDFVD